MVEKVLGLYPTSKRHLTNCIKSLTSTQGSHAKFFESKEVASTIPVGGPRKLSQTSRKRDSSASLKSVKLSYYVYTSRYFIPVNSTETQYYALVDYINTQTFIKIHEKGKKRGSETPLKARLRSNQF